MLNSPNGLELGKVCGWVRNPKIKFKKLDFVNGIGPFRVREYRILVQKNRCQMIAISGDNDQ